jgi:MFS family permease
MRAGLYLGLVQWLFAATWTIYVAFLPQLAAGASIDRKWVIWLLMLDQLLFAVMDLAMGVAADKVAAGMRRLSGWIVMITAASCMAFLLLPQTGSAALLLVLVVIWSVTSSVLRAPPMVLLSKYAPPAATPWLAQLSLLGLGLAGAFAPLLTTSLRGLDPRAPFALASIGLLIAVLGLRWAERVLDTGSAFAKPPSAGNEARAWGAGLVTAVAMLAVGFQIHTGLNSTPAYQRLGTPELMGYLMPLFWVGFTVAIVLVGALVRRIGAGRVLVFGALFGAVALAGVGWARQLPLLVAAQLAAGAAWALVVGCAVPAAMAAGRTGREGRNTGLVFSALAVAAFLRLSLVATEINKTPEASVVLVWLPALLWVAGAVLCAFAAWRAEKQARVAVPQAL